MKIFGRGGKEEWRYPNQWGYTASSTAAASTAKKNVMQSKRRNDFTAEGAEAFIPAINSIRGKYIISPQVLFGAEMIK